MDKISFSIKQDKVPYIIPGCEEEKETFEHMTASGIVASRGVEVSSWLERNNHHIVSITPIHSRGIAERTWIEISLTSMDQLAEEWLSRRGYSVHLPPDDIWGEDPEYSRSAWKYEVKEGYTNLGYWMWVEMQKLWNDEDAEFEVLDARIEREDTP